MYNQFIKSIMPLPSFFEISMPSDEEPSVFPVQAAPQCILCPICLGKTYRHDKKLRRLTVFTLRRKTFFFTGASGLLV